MDIKKVNSDITLIDKDNNRVISKEHIVKLDISDRCSYTDIVFTLLLKDKDINESCRDLLRFMINGGKSVYVIKDLVSLLAKQTMKSERTFSRCITDLTRCGLVRQSKDFVYLSNNVFNEIKHSTKVLIIEINPETNKINL